MSQVKVVKSYLEKLNGSVGLDSSYIVMVVPVISSQSQHLGERICLRYNGTGVTVYDAVNTRESPLIVTESEMPAKRKDVLTFLLSEDDVKNQPLLNKMLKRLEGTEEEKEKPYVPKRRPNWTEVSGVSPSELSGSLDID